jgi:sugar phosphate isomerase/epimerase
MVPDSPEAYVKLIKDVGRDAFAVHLDFVNMINCPERYCRHIDFIGHCFDLLGPYIKSIHGKDVIMEQAYTTLIHETRPGGGVIDYRKILPMVERLGPDTPLFVEHLSGHDEYKLVSSFVRSKGEEAGILIKG